MAQISATIKFSDFTKILNKIHGANSNQKKCKILSDFIEQFQKYSGEFRAANGPDCISSFYPILRLLLPDADRERDSYGIKTTTMGKLYIRVLAIDPAGEVAKKLTLQQGFSANQDYGDIVYDVMRNRCAQVGSLTVFDVNRHLDAIAECYQNNNRKKIDEELIEMINGMTADDQKWLIRIILKKMRLHLGQQTILRIYHPSAKDFYAQYTYLSRVCECVENKEESVRLEPGHVEPLQSFRPMLCYRCDIQQLDRRVTNKEFYLETKMDGERFQIHVKDDQYKYFSRRGYDFTNIYGPDSSDGTLTPFIAKLFRIKVKNLILDGEMMVWNREEQIYHTKGENYDVKTIRKNDSTLRPCFCAYDILYLNDVCLTQKPYGERIRLLATLFEEKIGFLTLCKPIKIRDSSHILECLNNAIDEREEGVVIKDADSFYAPGERNAGWCKIKPDYIEGLVSDFDLIIIGGYFNRSKRYIASYLLGVFEKTGNDVGKFLSVTKVSIGLSYTQSCELNEKLKPFWQTCKTRKEGRTTITNNPPNFELGSTHPDVWIEPKKSIMLEVKASEIVKTSTYATKYTLRFPRIVSIRSDKMWYDCCTLEEFDKLATSNSKVEKITKRHITSTDINDDDGTFVVPPKRKAGGQKKQPLINSEIICKIEDLYKDIVQIDSICDGLEFCILNSDKNMPSIDEMKRMVVRHGGRVVENPKLDKTFLCIAATPSYKVKKIIETGSFDLATVDWLVRALSGDQIRNELLPLRPRDMLCTTQKLADKFTNQFDEFGDSYATNVTCDELKLILESFELKDHQLANRNEVYDIEKELNPSQKPENIFRVATAFFYTTALHLPSKMQFAKILFKSKGGICVDQIVDTNDVHKISHIIVNPSDNFLADNLKLVFLDDLRSKKCISYEWILECNREKRKIKANNYLIKI